ncbi:synapsin-like, partial [Panonychus citri]|uniref:synapsin-like n=1 Tax=Panonychus citri TaxID=50023 RepID=UPI002306EEB6
ICVFGLRPLKSVKISDPRDFSKITFSSFRQSFSSTTNFLKRRFSSGDLQGEGDELEDTTTGGIRSTVIPSTTSQQSLQSQQYSQQSSPSSSQQQQQQQQQPIQSGTVNNNSGRSVGPRSGVIPANQPSPSQQQQQSSDSSINIGMKSSTTSAPTSPAKNVSSFLSRATSLTSSVTSNVAGVAGQISSRIKDPSKQKILLVIDDHQTDWSKYFRGKRLSGEFDIRVEQADFRELSVTTNSEQGALCSIITPEKGGNRSTRTFRPDFLLVRQHIKDVSSDFNETLLGLKYGGVPSVNSLHSIYNFVDRPWVFSQLIGIQRRLGRENFPLIEQTYYPSHRELLTNAPRFPCVIKIGHAHCGQGKMKIENPSEFQDIVSIVACAKTFVTSEPFIDSKCDIHIQKIGGNYKAFMRKSISGNWKANVGSSMLEQCPVTERYKKWIDEVSEVFNGLDIVTVEAVLAKDGQEYIYEVTGSQMILMGETQEEDRRIISELVTSKMQHFCGRPVITKQLSRSSITTSSTTGYSSDDPNAGPTYGHRPNQNTATGAPRRGSQTSIGSASDLGNAGSSTAGGSSIVNESSGPTSSLGQTTQQIKGLFRRASISTDDSNQPTGTKSEDPDDTMKNLRKTFAGIFGDM